MPTLLTPRQTLISSPLTQDDLLFRLRALSQFQEIPDLPQSLRAEGVTHLRFRAATDNTFTVLTTKWYRWGPHIEGRLRIDPSHTQADTSIVSVLSLEAGPDVPSIVAATLGIVCFLGLAVWNAIASPPSLSGAIVCLGIAGGSLLIFALQAASRTDQLWRGLLFVAQQVAADSLRAPSA